MPGQDDFIPMAYTEQDQTNYQLYQVYQSGNYVEGKGIKVSRCVTGLETPVGIIIRGGEGASATNPLSVVVKRGGLTKVKAAAGGFTYGQRVGPAANGLTETKDADGEISNGVALQSSGTSAGDMAYVLLNDPITLSVPAEE